jgi:2-polyprenyl-3-methyl-5-hydroxy-6-metoxy-1,4-benzoquinol methylase
MLQQNGQIAWLDGLTDDAPTCPVCGSNAPKARVLQLPVIIQQIAPPNNQVVMYLVACRECRTHYWTDLSTFHYEEPEAFAWGTRFYLEQGASIDGLIAPMARLADPAIRSCLEIGCGFGFSLDASRRLFGWKTVGVDPSPIARTGRDALNIDIRPIYADVTTDLGGPFDVVYGSEVIEHVATPHEFLQICRAHLAPGGTLILTTPDGSAIRPDVPVSIVLPILSPTQHLILFNADSLQQVAQTAGFKYTQIVPRENGLILYASDRPLRIDESSGAHRPLYSKYLSAALAEPDLSPELRTGLRYRLFKELVNIAKYDEALALFPEIAADCRARFGLELTPAVAAQLEETLRNGGRSGNFPAPFCLPGLLYFRGMIALNASSQPGQAADWFDAAALAASAFTEAYQHVCTDDGETGMFERLARELAIQALCHTAPKRAVDRLQSRPDRSDELIEATTFRLMDLGQFDQADRSAKLSSKSALAAMVDGWKYLVHGRNAKAHAALAQAIKADGTLGLRARSADMLALASLDPDAAVRLAQETTTQPAALGELFTRLIDLGHLRQAAAIEQRLADNEGWNILSHRGTLALSHAKNPELAAELFTRSAAQAPDGEIWNLKYQALLALVSARKIDNARQAVQEIQAEAGAVPKDVRAKLSTLMRNHSEIRP